MVGSLVHQAAFVVPVAHLPRVVLLHPLAICDELVLLPHALALHGARDTVAGVLEAPRVPRLPEGSGRRRALEPVCATVADVSDDSGVRRRAASAQAGGTGSLIFRSAMNPSMPSVSVMIHVPLRSNRCCGLATAISAARSDRVSSSATHDLGLRRVTPCLHHNSEQQGGWLAATAKSGACFGGRCPVAASARPSPSRHFSLTVLPPNPSEVAFVTLTTLCSMAAQSVPAKLYDLYRQTFCSSPTSKRIKYPVRVAQLDRVSDYGSGGFRFESWLGQILFRFARGRGTF